MIDLLFNDPEGLVNRAAFNERFGILNQMYRYWWKRSVVSVEYIENISDSNVQITVAGQNDDEGNKFIYITYNNSIVISSSGIVSLAAGSGTKRFSSYFSDSDYFPKSLSELKGKYASIQGSIYYFADDSTCSVSDKTLDWYFGLRTVTAQKVESGYSDYIFSTDRDAYPDSGIQNGYEYQYLGIPFENAREVPKIEVGSYLGTGTFGSSSPNTLTFPFTPIIWGVFRRVSTGDVDNPVPNIMLWDNNYQNMKVSVFTGVDSTTTHYITINGNSVSWYASTSSDGQLNSNICTYHYFAIG